MIRHLFKLIWNKKKQTSLLIIEIIISFLVTFAVFTLILNYSRNYSKERGFEYKNVWVVNYTNPWQNIPADTSRYYFENLKLRLTSIRGIESVSFFANNYPYSNYGYKNEISYKNSNSYANPYAVDEEFNKVLKLRLRKGRWFFKDDHGTRIKPVIINESLEEELFNGSSSLGEVVKNNNVEMKVVGVVNDIKDEGDYSAMGNKYFILSDSSSVNQTLQVMLVAVNDDANADFESSFFSTLGNYVKNGDIKIDHLSNLQSKKNKLTLVPVIILLIIAAFLIFNVALGLFGILWFNINKRKPEIALRIAVGASNSDISKQIVGEAMVLTTLSLVVGAFFALQFPLLNVFNLSTDIYIASFLLSVLFIYLLVFVCALYPGKYAAKVYPADTLHEN